MTKEKTKLDMLINEFENGSNIFITGQAGTGKTYLLNQFIEWLDETDLDVAIAGSTGAAAINIGGSTLHKLLGIQIRDSIKEFESYYDNDRIFRINFSKNGKWLSNIDVIIVDEISMISADFFDLFDHVLKKVTRSNKPFGGKRIIVTGDFLQLPPVSKGSHSGFAFESQAWQNGNIKNILLEKIHRQENIEFMNLLSQLRVGENSKQLITYLKEKENTILTNSPTRLFSRNIDVDSLNHQELEQIDDKEHVFTAEVSGRARQIDDLKKHVLAPEVLSLKVGAKVMLLKNHSKLLYVNGSIGTVHKIFKEDIYVKLLDGTVVRVKQEKWDIVSTSGKVQATFKQFPIRLAYAITIHKSQGATIDGELEIDCKGIFESGQLYVAISRVRDPNKLRIKNFKPNLIMSSSSAIEYYNDGLEPKQTLKINDSNVNDVIAPIEPYNEEDVIPNDQMEEVFAMLEQQGATSNSFEHTTKDVESNTSIDNDEMEQLSKAYKEIEDALESLNEKKQEIREHILEYVMTNGTYVSDDYSFEVVRKGKTTRRADYKLLENEYPEAYRAAVDVRISDSESLIAKKVKK